MSLTRNSVDAGQCMHTVGWGASCLISNSLCESKKFQSARQLVTVPGAHGGHCRNTKSTWKSLIGSCGDDGPCASAATLCDVPDLFQKTSDDCTVKLNHKNDYDDNTDGSIETKYGSCVSSDFDGKKTCFWSNDHCDDKGAFGIDENCTCDKVRVGACRKKNDPDQLECAVDADACDELQDFLSVVDMKTIQDCYLCREPPRPAPTPTMVPVNPEPVPEPTNRPTKVRPTHYPTASSPVLIPTQLQPSLVSVIDGGNKVGNNDLKVDVFTSSNERSNDGSGLTATQTGAIVGGIVGAAIVAILIVAAFTRRRRSSRPKTIESATANSDLI